MSERRRAVLVLPDAPLDPTLADARAAREDHEIVAVLAGDGGWYAALAVAGALSTEDAGTLLDAVRVAAASAPAAEQVVFPQTDAAWRRDARLVSALDGALALGDGQIHRSLDLGAYAVMTGTPAGVELLTSALPAISVGEQRYPLLLPARPSLHTPMALDVAPQMRAIAERLDWRMPDVTIIDGRGVRHTPWSTSPSALRDATEAQLVQTVRFAAALHVALREYAPDVIVIAGGSGILATVCAQLVVSEGYHGIRSRRAFAEAQRRRPLVLSMRH